MTEKVVEQEPHWTPDIPSTEEEEAGLAQQAAWEREEERRQTREFIRTATRYPGQIETDWLPERWWRRLAYLVKGWVCVILGVRPDYRKTGDYPDMVTLAYEQRDTYAGWESESLVVGRGLITGWWYDIQRDSEWSM